MCPITLFVLSFLYSLKFHLFLFVIAFCIAVFRVLFRMSEDAVRMARVANERLKEDPDGGADPDSEYESLKDESEGGNRMEDAQEEGSNEDSEYESLKEESQGDSRKEDSEEESLIEETEEESLVKDTDEENLMEETEEESLIENTEEDSFIEELVEATPLEDLPEEGPEEDSEYESVIDDPPKDAPKEVSTIQYPTLMEAVLANNLPECKRLVEAGKSVNERQPRGDEVPLHLAVIDLERLPIFRYLISMPGIDIEAQNYLGLTPLHMAVQTGWSLEPIQKLLDLGADIDQRDLAGRTALTLACRRGWQMVVDLLLVNGADASIPTNAGVLPVEAAMKFCSSDFVEFLLHYSYELSCAPPVYLQTLIAFSTYSAKPLFEYLLDRATEIIYDDFMLPHLARSLFTRMPFSKFCQIISNFSYVADDLLSCSRQILNSIFQNDDVEEYLEFLCLNSDHFEVFDANAIYFEQHYRDYRDVIEQSLIAMSYGSSMILDFHYLYLNYSDWYLTDVLFHLDVEIKPHPRLGDALAVPVLCNFELYPRNPVDKKICYEAHRYFKQGDDAPSLVEIGRDGARLQIMEAFDVKTCSQFLTAIKALDIPQTYKDVLTFNQCIY